MAGQINTFSLVILLVFYIDFNKILNTHAYIFCNTTQYLRIYVFRSMNSDSGLSSVFMTKLLMGAFLSNLFKTKIFEDRNNFS